jgi:hypothetical protein
MCVLAVALLCVFAAVVAAGASAPPPPPPPRYLLSRAEDESENSDGMVMLHTDLWMMGVPSTGADAKLAQIKSNEALNYTASIGIGINHPPAAINRAARYYNSWGQQALQQQAAASAAAAAPPASAAGPSGPPVAGQAPLTDGTGVNWVFHPELWPQLDRYFGTLAQLIFGKHAIAASTVKVIRLGMDKTGEFNYPYSSVTGGGVTNNSWWAFDEGGRPFPDYPLGSWAPGQPNSHGGNESSMFVDWYCESCIFTMALA